MPVISVTSLDDERLRDYANVKDAEAIAKRGIFIVESPYTVRRFASGARFVFRSAFLSNRLADLTAELGALLPETTPIYTADPELMAKIVGYPIHRGCLAVGECGPDLPLEAQLEADASGLVVVLEALSNVDNVGSVFRNAAALGAGLVIVDAACCDPLYRRSIRVSVGATLTLPFARTPTAAVALSALRARGYLSLALTPDASAMALAEAAGQVATAPKVALFVGTEGEGLGDGILAGVDLRVRIPMQAGMDSLNVAAATAVALYRLSEARAARSASA